jgi:simple sugar transport system substrate-binding protein
MNDLNVNDRILTLSDASRRRLLAAGALGASGLALPGALRQAFAQAPFTMGVIYVGPRDDFGYNQAHAEGVAQMKKLAGVKVVEEENVPETQAVQKSMQGMISQDGAKLLFPTSFGYFDPHMLAVAGKNEKVRFAHCGGLWTQGKHPANTGSFFGYIDEAQYLNGVIAGHMSKSKKLGFVAAKPIPQVLRNINAFTMGARSVDPKITTTVIFTGDWSMAVKEAEATNSLADQGVDVFTMHVDGPKVIVETAAKRGKMVCGYHASQAKLAPQAYLTGAEWNWVTAYTTIIEAARSGKPHPNFVRGGLKEGFVKSSPYGSMVPEAARKNADAIRARMMAGSFDIFAGELKDNTGKVVIAKGTALKQTDVTLESMNYLVEGVIGKV